MTIEGWFAFFLVEVSMLGILYRMAKLVDDENEESPPPEGSGLKGRIVLGLVAFVVVLFLLVIRMHP